MIHKMVIRTILVFVIFALLFNMIGCDPDADGNGDVLYTIPPDRRTYFVTAYFVGPSILTCTGENLEWENVGIFRPYIKLKDGPAESSFTRTFDIQGAKDIGSDWLGYLEASWEVGDEFASSYRYVPVAPDSNATEVEGSETLNGNFWLGCTKKCAVRGNAGKTGTSPRDVFFQSHDGMTIISGDFSPVIQCFKQ